MKQSTRTHMHTLTAAFGVLFFCFVLFFSLPSVVVTHGVVSLQGHLLDVHAEGDGGGDAGGGGDGGGDAGGGSDGGGDAGGGSDSGGSDGGGSNPTPPPAPPAPPAPTPSAPTCTLTASPSTILVSGHFVTLSWSSSNATSAAIDNGVGSISVNGSTTVYPSGTMTYTASFTGDGGTVSCPATITLTPTTPSGGGSGGGGGTVGGPGGLNAPTVVLLPSAGASPLAFVTLSQIPYTGFEGGPIEQALFWGFLVLWSAFLAYLLAVKKLGTKLLHSVRAITRAASARARTLDALEIPITPVAASAPAHAVAEMLPSVEVPNAIAEPEPRVIPQSATERKVELTAHAANCLISKDACTLVAHSVRGEETEALALVTRLAEDGKKRYPKEDGWILLNRERVEELLRDSVKTVTTIPFFVGWLAEGKREEVFGHLRLLSLKGDSVERFLTEVAAELDRAYRSRIEPSVKPDPYTQEKTAHLAPAELHVLIEALVGGLDGAYTSSLTAVKLAIARALASVEPTPAHAKASSSVTSPVTREEATPKERTEAAAMNESLSNGGLDEFLYAQIHRISGTPKGAEAGGGSDD